MKNRRLILCLVVLFLCSAMIISAKDDDDITPPWMEDVKVKGRSTYMVPKGAKRQVIGSQVVVEPPNEYVARRLYEIEQEYAKKFAAIEENQKKLESEIEDLKNKLEAIAQVQEEWAAQMGR